MAGKRGGYRGGKSAYRMTARRKSALRKAQLISAKKRKRNNAIGLSVGALAVASIGAYGGYKLHGSNSGIATDLKSRNFRFTNTRNSIQGRITPLWKERNMMDNAVSPASAAPQADPIKPPKASTSTPAPNNSTSKPKAKTGFGGATQSTGPAKPGNVTPVPSEGAVVDPFGVAQVEAAKDPNRRTPHPLAPPKANIINGLSKVNVSPENATWREIRDLATVWTAHLRKQGLKFLVQNLKRFIAQCLT